MKIDILFGKVVKDDERFIDVELFHVVPKRTIKNVAKLFPLDCDEREEECNIKLDIEVCVLLFSVSGHENAVCLGSSNQGIELGGRGISKIENLEEVQLISKVIKLMDNQSERDGINSKPKKAKEVLSYTDKFAVSNANDELVQLVVDLTDEVANLSKAFATHLTVWYLPHSKMADGFEIFAKVKILKEKIEAFVTKTMERW